jgi:hypothetical protein
MVENLDEDIPRIVAGCSPDARQALLSILSLAFNTLDNLEVICPMFQPPCHKYLRFERLRKLHAALNERAQVDRLGGTKGQVKRRVLTSQKGAECRSLPNTQSKPD